MKYVCNGIELHMVTHPEEVTCDACALVNTLSCSIDNEFCTLPLDVVFMPVHIEDIVTLLALRDEGVVISPGE